MYNNGALRESISVFMCHMTQCTDPTKTGEYPRIIIIIKLYILLTISILIG